MNPQERVASSGPEADPAQDSAKKKTKKYGKGPKRERGIVLNLEDFRDEEDSPRSPMAYDPIPRQQWFRSHGPLKSKEKFIKGSFRVFVSEDAAVLHHINLAEPDLFLDWQLVRNTELICQRGGQVFCPICLENELLSPRTTLCGHLFCFPCILAFLGTNIPTTVNGKKIPDLKKCPMCSETVRKGELRPVRIQPTRIVKEGTSASFCLVVKDKCGVRVPKYLKPDPGDVASGRSSTSVFAEALGLPTEKSFDVHFSRLGISETWYDLAVKDAVALRNAVVDSLASGEDSEYLFEALSSIECSVGSKLNEFREVVDASFKIEQLRIREAKDVGGFLEESESTSFMNVSRNLEDFTRILDERSAFLEEAVIEDSDKEGVFPEYKEALNASRWGKDDGNPLLFYQSVDGQHSFLLPLMVKMLVAQCRGDFLKLPKILKDEEVTHVKEFVVNESNRKTIAVLRHLSLGSRVRLVGIDIEKLVDQEVMEMYHKELHRHETWIANLKAQKEQEEEYYSQVTASLGNEAIPIYPEYGTPVQKDLDMKSDMFPDLPRSPTGEHMPPSAPPRSTGLSFRDAIRQNEP